MTSFVNTQLWRERCRCVAVLGNDVPGDDDVRQCLQSALRHGNGRLAHGDHMNPQWRLQRLACEEKETVMPIEHRSQRT
jgi:hypothetical protein